MNILEEIAVATVRISNTKKRIQKIYSNKEHSVSYSPSIINTANKKYILNYPLLCLIKEEKNYYTVTNEQLDIIGTGEKIEDAEFNFNEEFNFLYLRLNSLDDTQLSKRLARIKFILNSIVKEVQ